MVDKPEMARDRPALIPGLETNASEIEIIGHGGLWEACVRICHLEPITLKRRRWHGPVLEETLYIPAVSPEAARGSSLLSHPNASSFPPILTASQACQPVGGPKGNRTEILETRHGDLDKDGQVKGHSGKARAVYSK